MAAEAGYTVAGATFSPRPFVGLDTASGDRHRNDGHLETFNQLFPTGHPHLGYIDVVGRQNVIDVREGFEITPLENKAWAKKVTLRTEYHRFWRQSKSDALYNSAGLPLRGTGPLAATADSSDVGGELDLLLNWQIDRHAAAYFGYSHFFPGRYIDQTGSSGDIDFIYAALTYTF